MRPSPDESQAIAYANRAVMDWLLHERSAAQKDLAMVQKVSSLSGFVARKVAALKVHGQLVARAGTPAPRS